MFIPIHDLIRQFSIQITGILHVGAHLCEEKEAYNNAGVNDKNIYWIDAMYENTSKCIEKYGDDFNMITATIDEKSGEEVVFHITDNGQSSSLLPFGTHTQLYPGTYVVSDRTVQTVRLDDLIDSHCIPMSTINFINLDIQGVELRALKSLGSYIYGINYIYTEVNNQEVYKGCDQITDIDEYLKHSGFIRVATQFCRDEGWGDAFYIRHSCM